MCSRWNCFWSLKPKCSYCRWCPIGHTSSTVAYTLWANAATVGLISISIREGKGKEGEEGDGRSETGRTTRGRQRITGQAKWFLMGREPGNALPAPCSGGVSVAAHEPGQTSTGRRMGRRSESSI